MDEARIDAVKVSEIKSETGKTLRGLSFNQEVRTCGKCFELPLAVR